MELTSQNRATILIVVIIVIVILAFIMFRVRNQTAEERDANRARYTTITFIAVVTSVLIYFLVEANSKDSMFSQKSKSEDARPEYGVFTDFMDSRKVSQAESAARALAKKQGKSKYEIDEAGRQAKDQYRAAISAERDDKRARQKAAAAVPSGKK